MQLYVRDCRLVGSSLVSPTNVFNCFFGLLFEKFKHLVCGTDYFCENKVSGFIIRLCFNSGHYKYEEQGCVEYILKNEKIDQIRGYSTWFSTIYESDCNKVCLAQVNIITL